MSYAEVIPMRLLALIVLLIALSALLTMPTAQPLLLAQDTTPSELAHQMIELTNAERAAAGVPPLKMSHELTDAAMWMAQDMAVNEYAYQGGIDSLGRTAPERLEAFGYTNLRAMAENYAVGKKDVQEAFDSWMDSEVRRSAILDPEYREVGVGCYENTTNTLDSYWIQDLASRSNVYPVIINGEAATTDQIQVDLYIYGSGWANEMRLSHDGTNWTAWDDYQTQQPWQLEPGPAGQRTVFVELRGPDNTLTVSDSIELTVDIAPTATSTPTPTPTRTATPTPTATPNPTATDTPTPTASGTPTPTATNTPTPSATATTPPPPTTTTTTGSPRGTLTLYLPLVRRPTPTPTPTPTSTPTSEPQPGDTCLSADETRLAQIVNDYRRENGLAAVLPISKSLTQVGQAHVRDLHHYQPHAQPGCNLHSWSAQGHWSPVCYTADHANASGMHRKPREVTDGAYSYPGYENAYETSGEVNPKTAFDSWTDHTAHNDLILERGEWAGHDWLAMGVGIYEGYAVLWFGAADDPQDTVGQCS
jgi:uncharacterized protein YkwD